MTVYLPSLQWLHTLYFLLQPILKGFTSNYNYRKSLNERRGLNKRRGLLIHEKKSAGVRGVPRENCSPEQYFLVNIVPL